MITGSPYITNFSARKVIHAELTQTMHGQGPVAIELKYDATSHNNLKLVCQPSTLFATGSNSYNYYSGPKGRWGWVEKAATKGDIVEVVIQGLVSASNLYSGGNVGDIITFFKMYRIPYNSTGVNEYGYLGVEQVDGAVYERYEIQNNMGVLTKVGADGQFIIWQGVHTPYISDYSHGESHRVQAKLNGTYAGGDSASISAGQAVVLYLDTNGDLLARGGHQIGGSYYGVQHPDQDHYYINSGMWGITETGGASGDVVDIVVAGHCQTSDTSTKAGGQISNIGTSGEIYTLGGNVIINDSSSEGYNREFGGSSDWDAYNSPEGADATVDTNTTFSGKLAIQSTTDNWVQGAELPNDELTDLEEGESYIVNVQLSSDTGTPSVYMELCGGVSPAQSITTTPVTYTFEIAPIANTTETLKILTAASTTAYLLKVDKIYVMKRGSTTGHLSGDHVPNTLGVTKDDTGGIIIFPGVGGYDIKDYAEQHILTAVADEAIDTARKYAVSLYINKEGKLHAVIDSIASTKAQPGGRDNFASPDNRWGIALDAVSAGDNVKVLVNGRITDMDTTSDATWAAGDYLCQIAANGKKERETGTEYEAIINANDRSLESASNWVDYSPNTTITYNEDTANNRIAITGSGNGKYENDGSDGREGAHLTGTYLQHMNHDSTSMDSGALSYRAEHLLTFDVWYDGGGTPPIIATSTGGTNTTESGYGIPVFEDGTNTVTTTQRTMSVVLTTNYTNTGGINENLVICQINDTTDTWYFTNVSLTSLPVGHMQNKGICLNSDKKEWYIY